MNRKCLECERPVSGRTDKKFCGDHCRNAYNNRLNRDSKNLMRRINNKLRKNYRILAELNPKDKTKTSKLKLLERGFDFDYFTHTYTTRNGKTYFFLYDLGYLPLENDIYVLVKQG
ncbi:hypothetical protein [Sinomicrobium sp.]